MNADLWSKQLTFFCLKYKEKLLNYNARLSNNQPTHSNNTFQISTPLAEEGLLDTGAYSTFNIFPGRLLDKST